jgi:hypothetical protein
LLVVVAACRQPSPLASTGITIDGELSEPAWNQAALRGIFVDGGERARPYSEIRLLRAPDRIYVGLYAADEDIRSTDAFELDIGGRALRFDATGHANDSHVRAAVDRDGTLDRSDDDDEEWVIEAEVPAGPGPVAIRAARCDVTHAGARRCGAWAGTLP